MLLLLDYFVPGISGLSQAEIPGTIEHLPKLHKKHPPHLEDIAENESLFILSIGLDPCPRSVVGVFCIQPQYFG
jgi:hypothetical protein